MKKILFALLIFAFVGCEGIGSGELYIVPPTPIYVEDPFWGGTTEEGVNKYGTVCTICQNGRTIKEDTIKYPTMIQLPAGHYVVKLVSVFRNYWDEPLFSNEMQVVIRNNQTTRIDIPFY